METEDIRNANKLKKEIIKNFQNGELTKEDKKHVYVKEAVCNHGKNPWGGKCFYVGDMYLYLTGEYKCNIDGASKHLTNSHKGSKIKCKTLFVYEDSPIAEALGLNYEGFYYYNPDRLAPDSILSLKLLEVMDLPKIRPTP